MWEVGSRDGRDCFELAERIYKGDKDWFWSNADLVALEPNPAQFKIIQKNYPEMRVFEKAASNQNGFAPFKVYYGDEDAVGSSSLILDWKEKDLEGHEVQVETVRLEDMIGEDIINIMKIDVEGHGLAVLEGIGSKLGQIKVLHVETEVWTGSDKLVKHFMRGRGWTLVDEQEQWGGMPDLVFVAPQR